MTFAPLSNPLGGNPFRTRQDAQQAVVDLTTPLMSAFSPGKARVHLGSAEAFFDTSAAHLEGLARPLWGLAPLLAGGGHFEGISDFVEGIANGADPEHPEYWGPVRDRDQRMVESAAIGYALALAPETFWDGMTEKGRYNLANWLVASLACAPPDNNWHFFHVMVSLGLTRVGIPHEASIIATDLDELENYAMDNGWYRDGMDRRADHYIPFAMHFYGMIYAKLGPDTDQARRDRFIARARESMPQIAHWFAADGAGLPYGRSLTYRFAHAGIWGALAFADVDALPWGDIRGYWARNLRYWSEQDIADRSGVLSIGYGYTQPAMAERYNSPASPYWAMKAFAPLALPENHPFWTTEESPFEDRDEIVSMPQPGMIKWEDAGDVTVLAGGQQPMNFGRAAEKYNKFAYSTRYAFSVEAEARGFASGPHDNMLAFSEDGEVAHFRSHETASRIGPDWMYSSWSPMPEVDVETWLLAHPPWHLRIHRVRTKRLVQTIEGGFSIPRRDTDPAISALAPAVAGVKATDTASFTTAMDTTILKDAPAPIATTIKRNARVIAATPNTNILFPRSWVPQLTVSLEPGDWGFACWVLARPNAAGDVPSGVPDAMPTAVMLDEMRRGGQIVSVWDLPEH
ncbi:DUF2264 domain-containing protein [Yoonia sp. R2331]|uniref:DUF2264 domain-containing protein n=1 Tax=Yoonia sp. R2331 TaxID=3237238 RepID=UPI0034E513CA